MFFRSQHVFKPYEIPKCDFIQWLSPMHSLNSLTIKDILGWQQYFDASQYYTFDSNSTVVPRLLRVS